MSNVKRVSAKQHGEKIRLEIEIGGSHVVVDFDILGARHLLVAFDEALELAISERAANAVARPAPQPAVVPQPLPVQVDPNCIFCRGSGIFATTPCQMCHGLFGAAGGGVSN